MRGCTLLSALEQEVLKLLMIVSIVHHIRIAVNLWMRLASTGVEVMWSLPIFEWHIDARHAGRDE